MASTLKWNGVLYECRFMWKSCMFGGIINDNLFITSLIKNRLDDKSNRFRNVIGWYFFSKKVDKGINKCTQSLHEVLSTTDSITFWKGNWRDFISS